MGIRTRGGSQELHLQRCFGQNPPASQNSLQGRPYFPPLEHETQGGLRWRVGNPGCCNLRLPDSKPRRLSQKQVDKNFASQEVRQASAPQPSKRRGLPQEKASVSSRESCVRRASSPRAGKPAKVDTLAQSADLPPHDRQSQSDKGRCKLGILRSDAARRYLFKRSLALPRSVDGPSDLAN